MFLAYRAVVANINQTIWNELKFEVKNLLRKEKKGNVK